MKMKQKIIGILFCMLVILPALSVTTTADDEPEIEIGKIKAINRIFRMPTVLIVIKNEGTVNATDVNVSVNVKHRRFEKLDFTINETIESIPADGRAFVTFSLSWFGAIEMTVTADTDTETVNGRVFFGRILILFK